MRKKAEKKIREAAAKLGGENLYRIDRVRENTDLIRKVFDKTLLDMARVGAAELKGQDASEIDPAEAVNLIRHGDQCYVEFRFTDLPAASEKSEAPGKPDTTTILLKGIDRGLWRRFVSTCTRREGVQPADKIKELIRDYTRKTDEKD
jgi:hypothetical protein